MTDSVLNCVLQWCGFSRMFILIDKILTNGIMSDEILTDQKWFWTLDSWGFNCRGFWLMVFWVIRLFWMHFSLLWNFGWWRSWQRLRGFPMQPANHNLHNKFTHTHYHAHIQTYCVQAQYLESFISYLMQTWPWEVIQHSDITTPHGNTRSVARDNSSTTKSWSKSLRLSFINSWWHSHLPCWRASRIG